MEEINKLKLEISGKEIRKKCRWVSKRKCQGLPQPWRLPFLDIRSFTHNITFTFSSWRRYERHQYHKSPMSQHWLKKVLHQVTLNTGEQSTQFTEPMFCCKRGKGGSTHSFCPSRGHNPASGQTAFSHMSTCTSISHHFSSWLSLPNEAFPTLRAWRNDLEV